MNAAAHWDLAQTIAVQNDVSFPSAKREDFLRELGRIGSESRKDRATATGWAVTEVASLGKAWTAVYRTSPKGVDPIWRGLRASWAFVALR